MRIHWIEEKAVVRGRMQRGKERRGERAEVREKEEGGIEVQWKEEG